MEEDKCKNKIEDKPNNKSKKKYAYLAILVLIAAIGILIYLYSQKSAVGKVLPSKSESLLKKNDVVPESFSGRYLTFLFAPNFVVKSHDISQNPDDIFMERAYLSENTVSSKKISLTIRKLMNNNLNDIPDYQMRVNSPEKYKMEKYSADKIKGVYFVPAGETQFEKTYFFQNGNILAILSFIAPAMPDETLNKEADTIANSISWLK
jgi:hypothetical protein